MRSEWKYIVSAVVIILIVIAIRFFCISSYRISTDAVGSVLQTGDRVLVNKLHSRTNPGRGRAVVFRSTRSDASGSMPLLLNLCVGMPGDTVRITPEGYFINGQLLQSDAEKTFRILKNVKQALLETMQQLDIPLRSVSEDSLSLVIRLTTREETMLRQNFYIVSPTEFAPEYSFDYRIVIPYDGYEYTPDAVSLLFYADAIARETNGLLKVDGEQLMSNGKAVERYRFASDYYWLVSGNADAIDSRHLGFIPRSAIDGNVWFCWFSKDKNRIFKVLD